MARRRKQRADGSPARRSRRTPLPPPSAAQLERLERLTDRLPADLRAYRDRGLLSPARRFRLEEVIRHRTRTLVSVLHGVHDPHNQAAVLRSCAAFGVHEVHVVAGDHPVLRPSPRVTQNAHRWLEVLEHADFATAARALRRRGLRLWAASLDDSAVAVHDIDFTAPTGLVFGNEAEGLSAEIASSCDGLFAIPLYGLSQSLNISVAAAVTLWWAIECRRRAWGEPGDLTAQGRLDLRRRFYRQAAGCKAPYELDDRRPPEADG
jgi:tRNA (guanosine-2'-O-)-methyltransferase